MPEQTAAIVTIGAELTQGLRVDTNTSEIARALTPRGFRVTEALSLPDDADIVSASLRRLVDEHDLVVTTGGLGPTHDDITREAASHALGLRLTRDPRIEALLAPAVARHANPVAAAQVLVQADVPDGAEVIDPVTGTAPGLVIDTTSSTLALLPGPPSEMRPMLAALVARYPRVRARTRELGVVGMSESDAQVITQSALGAVTGVAFTVLARPGDVRVLLGDEGIGESGLAVAADAVRDALGSHCYSAYGQTLAAVVIEKARERGVTIGAAESCTGGMLSAELTEVSGASDAFLGSVVSYSNEVKTGVLDVGAQLLDEHGAVSEECARAMAEGARRHLASDIAVSITGIAGPTGGSAEKPVGLVWFALATDSGTTSESRLFVPGGREAVRARATATALNLLRIEVLSR